MSRSTVNEPLQTIEGYNLDPRKLIRLLQSVYGPSSDGEQKFWVEVRTAQPLHDPLKS